MMKIMAAKKHIVLLTLLIILIANSFTGMGAQDLKNATGSDQDIIITQHLIEVDAIQLKSENKLSIKETLVFMNIGPIDFFGSLKAWLPDGNGNIKVSKYDMTPGGGMIPIDSNKNGNIISWQDYIEKNSSLPFLYVLEYSFARGTTSSAFSKKFAFPPSINYRYMEKSGLPAIVIKITQPEGNTVKFSDENGNNIVPTEIAEKGKIFRFSSPGFKEINIDFSSTGITSTPASTVTVIPILTSTPVISKTSTPVPASTIQTQDGKNRAQLQVAYEVGSLENDRVTIKIFIKNKGNAIASNINLIIDNPHELDPIAISGSDKIADAITWIGELSPNENHNTEYSVKAIKGKEIDIPLKVTYANPQDMETISLAIKIHKTISGFTALGAIMILALLTIIFKKL